MTEMTKQALRKLCKDHGLYTTPHINDKLYLHYKGFNTICNLEEYVGLRALWLEGNGLRTIEGLEQQKELRTLYLHENIIEKIEGLENQKELDNINLSKNFIKHIENLSHMIKLTCLNLAHNHLTSKESIIHVLEIPSLQTIDLQHNKIDDASIVGEVFALMPDLRVLYLMGNPVVRKISNYRKTIVSKCKQLKYLDDRPVFDEERRRVDAWATVLDNGGSFEEAQEAERNEIKLIRQEKDEADLRNFKAFEQLMLEGREIRRQKELEASGGGGSASENDADDQVGAELDEINPFSGEKIIHVPESEELRLAREARWMLEDAPPPPVNSSILKQQQEAATAEVASAVVIEDVDVMSGASNIEIWKSIYREATNGQSVAVVPIVDQQLGVVEEKATADSHAVDGSTSTITENRHHHLSSAAAVVAAGDAASSLSMVPQLSEKKSKFMSLLTESIEEVSSVSTVVHHHPKVHDMEELD
jgi:dynein assembly factor 1